MCLGCDKNRVDLEYMINNFLQNGFAHVDEKKSQVLLINTCGFVKEARDEAIEVIKEAAKRKSNKTYPLEKIIVTGCMCNVEEVGPIMKSLPMVDLFVQLEDQKQVVQKVIELYDKNADCFSLKCAQQRTLTTIGSIAYLKICEGCNNFCSYCRIPLIRGRFRSTPIEELVKEAKALVKGGVRELVIIGQDVTNYGRDLSPMSNLCRLLTELVKIEKLKWVRLLYCYPENFSQELIHFISNEPKICKYIDIPFQHINDKILKTMNRRVTRKDIEDLLNTLKNKIPDIAIRTTFIVGFPGETKKQFKELLYFAKESEIAHIGVFAYSQEEGTPAAKMPNQINEKVKLKRKYELEKVAKWVQNNFFAKLIGQTMSAVCVDKIEQNDEGAVYEFRTQYRAPEVDDCVYVPVGGNEELIVGEFYDIVLSKRLDGTTIGQLVSQVEIPRNYD